ncbi:hypothetical protein Tco_1196770 [Tanacetum coccineum]
METKDTLSSCPDSEEQQMQQIQDKAKKSCMVSFRRLHSHLKLLSNNNLKGTRTECGFKRASATLFGQDVETFTGTRFLNVNQLEKQLDKKEFQERGSIAAFKYFLEYTQLEIREFRDTLIQHMGYVKKSIDKRALHKREHDRRVNERKMHTTEEKVDTSKALDANLVNTESNGTESGKQDIINRLRNDAHADDADIKPIYDEELMVEFTSQVDVNNDLSKPVTTHYLPKERESAVVKPHHVIASSKSRNSSKNMPRFSSNDMVHNHYLDEARKKTQEKGRNSEPSVMPSAKSQSTANDSKPKPRINNQNSRNWPASKSSCVTTKTVPIVEHSRNSRNFSDTKHFVCSTCQKCVFNANHRFLIKKTFVVHEKTITPRSCLMWKPTGKIFKTVGLRWIPTRKIFESSTTTVDSEPPHGSNTDFTNLHECIQTLDSSACTSLNVQVEQNLI